MTNQDFTKGVNFSVLSTADGSQHEQLIELAVPTADTGPEVGKGLVIVTTDSASNVPVVPNAVTTTKWKRYLWLRRPFAGETVKTFLPYAWNDDATSVPTYLKWVLCLQDTTQLQLDVATALSNAANALAIAAAAQTTANNADTNASAAVITANNAGANATTALSTANTANTNSTAAVSDAANAVVTANQALAAVAGASNPANLTPGAAGSKLRVKQDASAFEYFLDTNNYVKIADRQVTGSAPQALTTGAGWQKRTFQTIESDTGTNVSLAASVITLKKGTWLARIVVTGIGTQKHRARLRQTSGTPATLLLGTASRADANNVTQSIIIGRIVLATDTVTLEVQHAVSNNGDGGIDTTSATDVEDQVFSVAEFFRLD